MADWTNVPDSTFEPGAPAKGRDMRFLRDNPIAIAEGAPGAPRVQAAGLATGNNERDWVLARTAAASLAAVGTYAMLHNSANTNPGAIVSGSSLNYVAGMTTYHHHSTNATGAVSAALGSSPPGTWRCMSNLSTESRALRSARFRAGLWLRIS